MCICNYVSAISLLIFTAISMYSQSYPHLAATNLIISELCVKGERLLHFANKHTPPLNSTYKSFNYCTLGSTASDPGKDQATTKKNGITIPEPHMSGPSFGWVLVTVSRVTNYFLPVPPRCTDAQLLIPSAASTGSGQTSDIIVWGSSISWH